MKKIFENLKDQNIYIKKKEYAVNHGMNIIFCLQ